MNGSIVESPGCVVLLIDESAAMDSPIQEAVGPAGGAAVGQVPKSKAASVATALNALLKRLADGPDFDIALVSYKADAADQPQVGSRWGGTLAGREFVSVKELVANPITVETRTRKLPNPAGFGPPLEEPVSFPIWVTFDPKGKSPQVAAFRRCQELITTWHASAGPNPGVPLVLHIFAGGSGDGNPQRAIEDLLNLSLPTGAPVVLQAQLSNSKLVPTTSYPSNRYYLPVGPEKDLFSRCSVLPEPLINALKLAKVSINAGAVGMLYNAKMVDIAGILKLVEAHTKSWPPRPLVGTTAAVLPNAVPTQSITAPLSAVPDQAAPQNDLEQQAEVNDEPPADFTPSAERERAALLALILDRSLADPFNGDTKNACSRLQEHLNDLLGKLAKRPTAAIDVAIVSYGTDSAGDVEIRSSLEGSLAGKTLVRDSELAEGALRIEELEQQVPNGIGGLMTINVKRPVFLELEPTGAASPVSAFAHVGQIITDWCGQHPRSKVSPVVLHLTRGQHDSAQLDEAITQLHGTQPEDGQVSLCHLVVTEMVHRSVIYPVQPSDLDTPDLQKLFELTSPVLDHARLEIEKPAIVRSGARGLVVNGKIDLLVETILQLLDS